MRDDDRRTRDQVLLGLVGCFALVLLVGACVQIVVWWFEPAVPGLAV